MKEKVAPGFWEKIKDKTREKLRDFSPIQRRLLDPRAPLDEPTIKYRIRYAGQSHLLLYMLYNDQWRHVEPYSYRYRGKPKNPQGKKELLFFGYCRPHDEIHAFKLEKIQGLIVTDEPFTPRWPIEVD